MESRLQQDDDNKIFPRGPGQSGAAELTLASLPGYPTVPLSDTQSVARFLSSDLITKELDSIAPYLWMMSTFSSSNINPLHAQKVKGREVVICEYPRLHLTWKHSQIFVKPLPKYLVSQLFWDQYLVATTSPLITKDRERLLQAGKGLLRTYYYLIRYESDFKMAASVGLLPPNLTWEEFSTFIAGAGLIEDDEVSPRYQYGEIRLTRLNFYAKIFLKRGRYEWGRQQYSTYFSRFYGHVLFAFAIMSLLLNALQVELATESLVDNKWSVLAPIFRYLSVICIVILITISLLIAGGLVIMIADEWIYAIKAVREKRKRRDLA